MTLPLKHRILERLGWRRPADDRSVSALAARQAGTNGRSTSTKAERREATAETAAARRPQADSLGPYAPLVAAVRAELERFVATDLRLHRTIAAQDHFRLTAIAVRCPDNDSAAAVLERFRTEFKPEQITRFLARAVINGLPNAAAIDLSQFEGLRAAVPRPSASHAPAHAAPVAPRNAEAHGDRDASAYTVLLEGHWYEPQPPAPATLDAEPAPPPFGGQSALQLHIEDQGGVRDMPLPDSMHGRRYGIGKDPGSDIVVDGTYASRRHCELWLDRDRWWVADAGSTNGIRVELQGRVLGASGGNRAGPHSRPERVEVVAGAEIVLSADALGPASDYPRVTFARKHADADLATPLAPGSFAVQTPITPAVLPAPGASRYIVEATTAEGVRAVPLETSRLPWSVGRSRRSAMVVPGIHEGVSGHHLEVVTLDEDGAEVLVHGGNGVRQGRTAYGAGDRFRWRVGEVLELGRASAHEPRFALKLFQDTSAGNAPE
jgi:pSer/pThr/pTyr-binding forkhead associated (FHA) protein